MEKKENTTVGLSVTCNIDGTGIEKSSAEKAESSCQAMKWKIIIILHISNGKRGK